MFKKKTRTTFNTKIPEPQLSELTDLHKDNLALANGIREMEHDIALKRVEMKYNSARINTLAYEAIIAAGYDTDVEVDLDHMKFRKRFE